ncbi:MAG: CBS domain-containing protein [Thermoplasmata archaeon]
MTKKVVTLSPEDTIASASMKMSAAKISGAPVTDESGKLIGILSEADILRSLKTHQRSLHLVYPSLSAISVTFREQITEREASDAYKDIENMKVKEIMTKEVETVREDEEIRGAIKKMISRGINRLPVVDDENKVIGIVTRGDILRGIASESNNNAKR